MLERLQLTGLSAGTDSALLFARVLTGAFLVHGVWDNVSDSARMAEFIGSLRAEGFPQPALAAPFSVYTQLLAGGLLIVGLLSRIAGLLVVATFVAGYIWVHLSQSFREGWPALALVAIGFIFATAGGGRYAFDGLWGRAR